MDEIYKIVGYDEAIAEIEPPPEYVKTQAYLHLGRVSFSLVGTPHAGAGKTETERQLMSVVMSETTADVVMRPKNICLGLQVNSFYVDEAVTEGSRFGRMISTPAAAQGSKFLEVGFEIAPLKGHADTVARVSMSSTNIVVTKQLIDRLGAFFAPRRKISAKTLRDNTTEKLWNAVSTSKAQLERAVKDHKTMDVSIRIEAPSIIIPQDATSIDTMLLVLDLGELSMRSKLKDGGEDGGKSDDDDDDDGSEKSGLDEYYDQYVLDIDNIQVLLINNSEEAVRARIWRDEKYQSWDSKIVEYFSFNFVLKTCIQPSELTLSTTIVSGELPALRMNMSVQKLRRLLALFKTFVPDKPHDMELAEPAESKSDNNDESSDEEEEDTPSTSSHSRAITADEYLSEEQQLTMEKQAKLMDLLVNHTEIEASFMIKEITLSLTDDTDKNNKKDLISIVISRTAADYNKKTFSMAANASLGSLVVYDCFAQREGLAYPYFATSELLEAGGSNSSSNLMSVKYESFDRHTPVHNKVDSIAVANFHKLHLFVNPDTIASLITFSKTLTFLKSDSATAQKPAVQQQQQQQQQDKKEAANTAHQKEKAATHVRKAEVPVIVPGKYKVPEIVKMKVDASVDLVEVVLLKRDERLAEFQISGIHCGLSQKERTMTAVAELENVTLVNPNADKAGSLYKYVITKNDMNASFVNVSYSTYSVEEVGFPGYNASVEGIFRSMNIIPTVDFLVGIKDYIMDGPLLKALNTDAVKETVKASAGEVTDKVGDAATELVEKMQEDGSAEEEQEAKEDDESANDGGSAQKMKLDITLEAPSIIVPRNSRSRDSITLKFGVLHVDNEFIEDPAVAGSSIDKMNIKFSKMLMDAEFDDISTPVITDISADIVFERSLNLACKEVPNQRASVLLRTFSLDIKKREVDFIIDLIGSVTRTLSGDKPKAIEDKAKPDEKRSGKDEEKAEKSAKKDTEVKEAKSHKKKVGTFNKKLFEATAVVEQLSLRLIDDSVRTDEKEIIAFVISDVRASFCQQSFNMQATASLGALMVRDCMAEAAGLEYRHFATSRLRDDETASMLSVRYEACQRDTPVYNGVDTLIDANFNNLYFIFNPDTLAATLKLVKSLDFSGLQGASVPTKDEDDSGKDEAEKSRKKDEKVEKEVEEKEEEEIKDIHAIKSKIDAKLNAIGIVLIKDNKKMADFSISGVQGSVVQKEYSMDVKAEIQDLSFVNKLVESENNRIIAKKDQGKNFASLHYSTYSPKEGADKYPGYDTYVEAIMRSLDITPSVDYLLDLKSYFMDGPLLKVLNGSEIKERVKNKADETSERIGERTKEAIEEMERSKKKKKEEEEERKKKELEEKRKKDGSTGKMRLNAVLEASSIIVPLSATSTEKVTAKLGSLRAESIPAAKDEDADLDKMRIAFSDMYVETCYKDGTVLPLLKEVSMGVAIDRSLNPGNGRIPDMKIDAVCKPFEMQVSEGQVAFLLDFSQKFTESLNAASTKEKVEESNEKLIEDKLDEMRDERAASHRVKRNPGTRKRRQKRKAAEDRRKKEEKEEERMEVEDEGSDDESDDDDEEEENEMDCADFLSEKFEGLIPKMDMHFELARIALHLYRGEGIDDPLALFELKGAVAGMKTLPNDFMVAEAVLESIALSDLRNDTKSMYRDMITYGISDIEQQEGAEGSKKKKKVFMNAKYVKKGTTGDQAVALEVYEPTIYLLPSLLISVQNFFVNPLSKNKKEDDDEDDEDSLEEDEGSEDSRMEDDEEEEEIDVSVLIPERLSGENKFQTPYVKNVEDEITAYVRLCRKLRKNRDFRGSFTGAKLVEWIKKRYPDELSDEQAHTIAARMLKRGTITTVDAADGDISTFDEKNSYTRRVHRNLGGIRGLLASSSGTIGDSLLSSSLSESSGSMSDSSDTEDDYGDVFADEERKQEKKKKRRPGMYAKVALTRPQIHILQDEFRDDSFCVWVTGDFGAKYTQSPVGGDEGVVDVRGLRIQLLRMEGCKKQLGERVDSILNPLTMAASYKKDERGAQKVAASIPDGIEIAFSYQNTKLIMGVLDTLSPLWGGDNSGDNSPTEEDKKKKKEKEKKKGGKNDDKKKKEEDVAVAPRGAESLRFSCPKITVYLINDFGGRNVPVLALGLDNVGVTIRDWSSNLCLVFIGDLSTDFFNENLMWYEPLIEPWHFVACIYNGTAEENEEEYENANSSNKKKKTKKIELSAKSYLNINVTQAFVGIMARTYAAISQDYNSIPTRNERLRMLHEKALGVKSGGEDGDGDDGYNVREQVFHNLYIRNKTYFPFNAHVKFDMPAEAVKDEAKARKITFVEDLRTEEIALGSGEMAPVTLGVGGAEALRTTITQQRLANISFADRAGKFEVYVDKVGTIACQSKGSEMLVSEVTWNEDGSKLATLRAAVQVQNRTDIPVEMLVWRDAANSAGKPDYTIPVPAGASEPIPYGTAQSGCLRLRPLLSPLSNEDVFMASNAAITFAELANDAYYSMRCAVSFGKIAREAAAKKMSERDVYLLCRVEDMVPGYGTPFGTIAVYPPAVVTNAMPCAIEFKLGHLLPDEYCAKVKAVGTLERGETRNLYTVDPRFEMLFSLKNMLVDDPNAYSESVRVNKISKKRSVFPMFLEDASKRKLRVDVETCFNSSREFVFYVPYWIENRSRIPLHYGTAPGTPAPGSHDDAAEASAAGAMFLYSWEKLAIRAEGSARWSRKFAIGTVGANGVIEIAGDDEGRRFYSLKVACYLAEGVFSRTKIITLSPSTVFVNKLSSGISLRVRQSGIPESILSDPAKRRAAVCRLKRGEHAPFHWSCYATTPGKDIVRTLEATIGDGPYKWSGAFTVTDVGENYLKLASTDPAKRPDYFLRYEVVESSYVTFVVFKDNDPDAPAPYRIENSTNYPVRLRQRGTKGKYATLGALSTMDFGWDDPLGKKEVELRIDAMGLRESKMVCKLNKIETFKPIVTDGRKTLYAYTRADGPIRVLVITFSKLKFRRETRAFKKDSKYNEEIERIDDGDDDDETEENSIRALANAGGEGDVSLQKQQVEETEISVNLESGIVISLVTQKPFEFCVLSFKDIAMLYTTSAEQMLFEFKLGSLQLDNQDVNAEFPIVIHGARGMREDEPWLHLSMAKSTLYDTIDYYTYFAFLIQELSISIESDFINTMLDFYRSLPLDPFTSSSSSSSDSSDSDDGAPKVAITCSSAGMSMLAAEECESAGSCSSMSLLDINTTEHDVSAVKKMKSVEKPRELKPAWELKEDSDISSASSASGASKNDRKKRKKKQQQKKPLTEWETEGVENVTGTNADSVHQKMMYFRLFHLNPIKINFTFTNKPGAVLNLPRNVGSSLIESLVGTLANVDNAPLRFNALLLDNPFCTKSALVHMIMMHYTRQAVTEVLKLIGSVDVLGNPVGLFTNIGTGVKDFFYEPAQGIVKSPAEFASGLGRGTKSMIKNTVSGLFNSVSKITGALGKGVATLSFDEDYIREHDLRRNKRAMTISSGILQGTKALFLGIAYGVSGLFTKPVLGAVRGGGKGLILGIYQGVVGVVIKPATGILDLFSKISEGVKNNALMLGAPEAAVRQHQYPRLFGTDDQMLVYSPESAEIAHKLSTMEEFANDKYVFDCAMQGQQTLVITDNHISVVRNAKGSKKKLVTSMEYSGGSNFDLCGEAIVAHVPETGKRSEITFDSSKVAAYIFEIIRYYIKSGNDGESFVFSEIK